MANLENRAASQHKASTQPGSDVTTFMLCRVPFHYRVDELYLELVHLLGTEEAIDFVYLPWDATKGRNVGYGFINVAHKHWTQTCVNIIDNKNIGGSEYPCSVVPAKLQGVARNLQSLQERTMSGCLKQKALFMWKGKIATLDMVEAVLGDIHVATSAHSSRADENVLDRLGRVIAVPDPDYDVFVKFLRRWGQ